VQRSCEGCIVIRAAQPVKWHTVTHTASFGIGTYVAVLDHFWVRLAAVAGVYLERRAGSSAVSAMQELWADIARS
jgi:hypothetical protein